LPVILKLVKYKISAFLYYLLYKKYFINTIILKKNIEHHYDVSKKKL